MTPEQIMQAASTMEKQIGEQIRANLNATASIGQQIGEQIRLNFDTMTTGWTANAPHNATPQ